MRLFYNSQITVEYATPDQEKCHRHFLTKVGWLQKFYCIGLDHHNILLKS